MWFYGLPLFAKISEQRKMTCGHRGVKLAVQKGAEVKHLT
jgi:photosystem II stability/assembly factor-like uncharacterized protein